MLEPQVATQTPRQTSCSAAEFSDGLPWRPESTNAKASPHAETMYLHTDPTVTAYIGHSTIEFYPDAEYHLIYAPILALESVAFGVT